MPDNRLHRQLPSRNKFNGHAAANEPFPSSIAPFDETELNQLEWITPPPVGSWSFVSKDGGLHLHALDRDTGFKMFVKSRDEQPEIKTYHLQADEKILSFKSFTKLWKYLDGLAKDLYVPLLHAHGPAGPMV